jgi:hypothetical protein
VLYNGETNIIGRGGVVVNSAQILFLGVRVVTQFIVTKVSSRITVILDDDVLLLTDVIIIFIIIIIINILMSPYSFLPIDDVVVKPTRNFHDFDCFWQMSLQRRSQYTPFGG